MEGTIASISSMQQIDATTISTFNVINNVGYNFIFDPTTIQDIDFFTVSSLTTYDLSGVSTNYIVDISGAINLSTVQGLNAISELSTMRGMSTMEGISTVQGIAKMANYQVLLDDIINSHNTLIATEQYNKTTFNSLDFSVFKSNLYKWAAQGYPDSFQAYSFPVTTPLIESGLYTCSDGNPKTIWDYIPYCIGYSINDWLSLYQEKVNGITLAYSVNQNPYTLNIHVTRKTN